MGTQTSPSKYQLWLCWSNSKGSVVSSAPWWTHKSWLCRYWAPAQTETLLLPGFMCHKKLEGCDLSKQQLWTETHCQPYYATQEWNITSWMARTSSASSLVPQQRLKKICFLEYKHSLTNEDTHMQEVMHPETTAAICAWQSQYIFENSRNTKPLSEKFRQKFHQFQHSPHTF